MTFKRYLLLTALALTSAAYGMEPSSTTTVEQAQSTDTLELLLKELSISKDALDQATLSLLKEKITRIFDEFTEKNLLVNQGLHDAVLQYRIKNPKATNDQIMEVRKVFVTQAYRECYNDFDQAVASLNEFMHIDLEALNNAIKAVTDQAMADALFKLITNVINSCESNAFIIAKLIFMRLDSGQIVSIAETVIPLIEDEATKTRFFEGLNTLQKSSNLMKLQHPELMKRIRSINVSDAEFNAARAGLTMERWLSSQTPP